MPFEINKEASSRQIAHPMLSAKEIGIYQPLGLGIFLFKDQLPDHRQHIHRIRIIIIIRTACPKCFLIKLEFFTGRPARKSWLPSWNYQ